MKVVEFVSVVDYGIDGKSFRDVVACFENIEIAKACFPPSPYYFYEKEKIVIFESLEDYKSNQKEEE